MRLIAIAIGVIALALAGCGGEQSNDSLVLSSGTYSEDEFRVDVRANLSRTGAEALCQSLKGLSNREIAELVVSEQEGAFTPVQEPNEEDRDRAAAILREECERVF